MCSPTINPSRNERTAVNPKSSAPPFDCIPNISGAAVPEIRPACTTTSPIVRSHRYVAFIFSMIENDAAYWNSTIARPSNRNPSAPLS